MLEADFGQQGEKEEVPFFSLRVCSVLDQSKEHPSSFLDNPSFYVRCIEPVYTQNMA